MARCKMLAIAIVGAALWSPLANAESTASKDPSAGPGACARMRCAAGTRCVNSADGKTGKCTPLKVQVAKCDPHCKLFKEQCVYKEVVCIKAPCPPVPTCVAKGASTNPCETQKCADGQTCVMLTSNPPKASCIDSSSLPGVESSK